MKAAFIGIPRFGGSKVAFLIEAYKFDVRSSPAESGHPTDRLAFPPSADPRWPREVGHFLPDVPEGSQRVQSNASPSTTAVCFICSTGCAG
jgi:hypothetical protein